jgi:tripartite-type tricarboxylate transporter receptor subunit TctC
MKSLLKLLIVSLAALVAAPGAMAQAYPTKPIKIIVPYGPGGVADIAARVLAQRMSETMGQQVLVDNRPSAGGIIASDAVAKAAPDGYTLLFMTNGNAVSASLFKTLPYDTVNDFAPISTVGFFDILVLVNPDSPFKSAADLVAYGKANPGKLNFGSVSIGSTQNLAAELFKSMAGLDVQVVPFKATADVITALKRNDVQAGFEITAPVMAQIKGGAVRAIGIASNRRFSGLPDVPPATESGLPGYLASSWNAMAAPAKTPPAIIEKLNHEVNAAINSPQVKQRLLELGIDARAGTPAALKELLAAEIVKWRTVIERAKIPKQ